MCLLLVGQGTCLLHRPHLLFSSQAYLLLFLYKYIGVSENIKAWTSQHSCTQ